MKKEKKTLSLIRNNIPISNMFLLYICNLNILDPSASYKF